MYNEIEGWTLLPSKKLSIQQSIARAEVEQKCFTDAPSRPQVP